MQDLIKNEANKSIQICYPSKIYFDQLTTQNIEVTISELERSNKLSINFLAKELLPRFMNSKLGFSLINILRVREEDGLTELNGTNGINRLNDPKGPLRTVALNISRKTETFWFEMYKVLSESVPIGEGEYLVTYHFTYIIYLYLYFIFAIYVTFIFIFVFIFIIIFILISIFF